MERLNSSLQEWELSLPELNEAVQIITGFVKEINGKIDPAANHTRRAALAAEELAELGSKIEADGSQSEMLGALVRILEGVFSSDIVNSSDDDFYEQESDLRSGDSDVRGAV